MECAFLALERNKLEDLEVPALSISFAIFSLMGIPQAPLTR